MPRESIGHYTGLGQKILIELNSNILDRDEEKMAHIRPCKMGLFYLQSHYELGK